MRTKEEVEIMVEENVGLVKFTINKYFHEGVKIHDTQADDIFQEGMIGLFSAAKTFDETRGVKFTTYAVRAISNCIIRYFERFIYKHYRSDVCSMEKTTAEDDGISIIDVLGYEEPVFSEIELFNAIRNNQRKIKDIEKIVVMKLQGYFQREIAEDLGVTQVEICRRLKILEKTIAI
ncbi:MAG: sigma-70 family RNA polymerase sigma factor [Paraclostridium sp.]